jgi:hypothetical protein
MTVSRLTDTDYGSHRRAPSTNRIATKQAAPAPKQAAPAPKLTPAPEVIEAAPKKNGKKNGNKKK